MMANHGESGRSAKPSSSTPVKWTLVEAEPETPEGRRKQQGYARTRGQGGSSSVSGNWRSSRDGGRGRGGGQGSSGGRGNRRGGGGTRNNQGQGRGRGYGGGGYVGGATYYGNPSNFGGNESPSFEEQKTYMTNMAVRQIEFYFTVENLCRDIFMRSYMDEEGYIPIAFVANFPGVARFGVELQDITAGILASDSLQVDTENETMRMREGWEVWLLPNQATGKQGVPRYIKVDPATVSLEPKSGANGTEAEGTQEKTAQIERCSEASSASGVVAEETVDADETTALESQDDGSDEKGESIEQIDGAASDRMEEGQSQGEAKTELTPTAPAWTPHGADKDIVEQESSIPESSPVSAPVSEETEGTNRASTAVPATEKAAVFAEPTKAPKDATPQLSN